MARMMTMLCTDMAVHAKIIIVTGHASNKFLLWENFYATVACSCRLLGFVDLRLLLFSESAWHFLLSLRLSLNLGFWTNSLSGTVDNCAVLHESLDHPMTCTRAVDALVHTTRTEVIITIVTNATMEMLVGHRAIALIAVHHP